MIRKLLLPTLVVTALASTPALTADESFPVLFTNVHVFDGVNEERVENANAMAVLFQLGLDYMQGHYVHEPEVVLQDAPEGKPTSLAELAAANGN